MSYPTFDAAGAVKFDLDSGTISSSEDDRLALLPVEMLSMLEPGDDLHQAARRWGESHGRRLAAVIAAGSEPTTLDLLVDHLGGAVTVAGLGKFTLEIRGDALLLRISQRGNEAPAASAGRTALIAGFLAGYLNALDGIGFEVLPLASDATGELFWAGNPTAMKQVIEWLEQGVAPLDALDRLGQGGAS